ncbi:MAG: uncharacterized protein QOE71_1593 [Pseudonocardiales bacterium]|nr:uncharacterized protein [Pseudonocardiales bacterium]
MLDDVLCDLRTLDFVLAHGGRGWWYDAAGFLTLSNEHVWIELTRSATVTPAGLLRTSQQEPTRPSDDFGTDSPGIRGIARNNLKVS